MFSYFLSTNNKHLDCVYVAYVIYVYVCVCVCIYIIYTILIIFANYPNYVKNIELIFKVNYLNGLRELPF